MSEPMQPDAKPPRSTEVDGIPSTTEYLEYPSGTVDHKMFLEIVALLIAYVGTYFALTVHVTGSGLLSQSIVAVVGGSALSTWLTLTIIIYIIILGPSMAQAADLFGRKWFVVCGTATGVVGCIVTSRANSISMAITGQAIAGLAQVTQGIITAIMSEILPRKYRPVAQGIIMTSIGTGSIVALYVGGVMCRHNPEGFRNFFYFNATVFLLASVIFAVFYNPPLRQVQLLSVRIRLAQFDYGGAFFTLVAFLGISVGLGWSQNPYSWHNAHILAPFIVGICGLIGLILYAVFVKEDGIYRRELFKSRNFVVAEICFFAEGAAFLTFVNYVPYQIQFLYDKDAFQTALEYSIAWYVCIIAALLAGAYCSWAKQIRLPIIFSFVCMVIYWGLMASTNKSTHAQPWGYAVLYGVGIGVTLNVIVVLAQLAVPAEFIATASGLMLGTRAAGGVVSIAAANAILHGALSRNLGPMISKAALPLGLPPSSLGQLIGALTSHDDSAVQKVPGITPEIIGASVGALKDAFTVGFRNIYIMTAAFSAFALLASFFTEDPRDQFTSAVDAPLKLSEGMKKMEVEEVEKV